MGGDGVWENNLREASFGHAGKRAGKLEGVLGKLSALRFLRWGHQRLLSRREEKTPKESKVENEKFAVVVFFHRFLGSVRFAFALRLRPT